MSEELLLFNVIQHMFKIPRIIYLFTAPISILLYAIFILSNSLSAWNFTQVASSGGRQCNAISVYFSILFRVKNDIAYLSVPHSFIQPPLSNHPLAITTLDRHLQEKPRENCEGSEENQEGLSAPK